MTLQNDDLLLVNRGGQSFKTEYGVLKENINEDQGVTISETAPADPHEGDLWYNSEDGRLYVWYVNETTGIVTSVSIRNGGSGYTTQETNVETAGGEGFGLTVDIDPGVGGNLANPQVNNGGHGYKVGDYIIVIGAGHQNATLNVTAINTASVGQWVDASPDGGDVGGGPDLWQRTGTTLSPVTAGDDVDLGSGDISATDATLSGDLSAAAGTFSGDLSAAAGTFSGIVSSVRDTSTDSDQIARWGNSSNSAGSYNGVFNGNGLYIGDNVRPGEVSADSHIQLNATGEGAFSRDTLGSVALRVFRNNTGADTFSVNASGDVKIGGTLPASPNITLNADGEITWAVGDGRLGYNATQVRIQSTGKALVCVGQGQAGTQQIGTGFSAIGSERRLKNIIGDVDLDQCWDLVKGLKLREFYFKDQEDQSGIPYAGPIVDELEKLDPTLILDSSLGSDDEGPLRTFNQPLLTMKALGALSAALTRIEALEAEVQQLKGGN